MRHLNTLVCAGLIAAASIGSAARSSALAVGEAVFLDDADVPAGQWANANPASVAVSVHVGKRTPVARSTIEYWIRRDFEESGIGSVRFFYERGGSLGSSLAYHTRNHTYGPYALSESRGPISEIAKQLNFEIEKGLN